MQQLEIEPRFILQAGRAAKSALVQWYSGQWSRQAEQVNDLANELLVWYMETPSTRRKMTDLSDPEVMVTFRHHARELLSRSVLEGNIFEGKVLYSSESVKDALKGESSNIYLKTILPLAMKRISRYHREALARRYVDGEFPADKREEDAQRRATKSLCNEINVLYITQGVDAIGSKSVIFPDTVRQKGTHGDTTANTALALMSAEPSYADEYLYESPWEQVCKGAGVEPVINFGPSGKFRLTAAEYYLFSKVPGLIDLFIDQKTKEWNE
jgi:hypothetical protein